MHAYPTVYREAMPIAPPIDPQAVDLQRSRMPARRTHRSMAEFSTSAGQFPPSSIARSGLSSMPGTPDDFMRQLANMMCGAMMGHPATGRRCGLLYPSPRGVSPIGHLALQDSLPETGSDRGSPETPRPMRRQASLVGVVQGELSSGSRQSSEVPLSLAPSTVSGSSGPAVALENDARQPPQLGSIIADMQVALGISAASDSKTAVAPASKGVGPVGKSKAKAVAKSHPKAKAQSKIESKTAGSSKSEAKWQAASRAASSSDGLPGKVRVEWSRGQVVACADRKGPGSCKTFKFSGTAFEPAAKKARQWLSEQ